MNPSVAITTEGERYLQSPFFRKLGNYFDRPEWWEEGAATLSVFFDDDTPSIDAFDQRLEDLLDLLEPSNKVEEPQQSNATNVASNGSTDHTAHQPLLQLEQDLDREHGVVHVTQLSSDDHLQTSIITPSSDLLPSVNAADIHLEENRVVPAIPNPSKDISFLSEDRFLVRSLPTLDTNTIEDAVDTSSPNRTGTTTSTRQTSPQLRSSTRASSVVPDVLENGLPEPLPFEVPKSVSSVDTVTAHHIGISTPPNITGLTAVRDDVSNSFAHAKDSVTVEQSGFAEERIVMTEHDVTGIQAIKDELSDEYGLTDAVDSSILTQHTDITVVHDPSSAAISFFPPNPYSESGSILDATGIPFEALNTQFGYDGNNKEIDEDLSADSSLTSLAIDDESLPQSRPEQPSDLNVWRNVSPSPPPTSPLTPPPGWFATRHTDQDTMGGADLDEDVNAAPSTTLTPNIPITEVGEVPPSRSTNIEGLKVITESADELAGNTGIDEAEMPTPSMATLNKKRKQDGTHPDEPSRKKRLRASAKGGEQPRANAESVLPPEETIKGTVNTAQRSKGKAKRDSPEELAPGSPDELADIATSNPFSLNTAPPSLAKPRLNRSTANRSRARKPVETSVPLRKLVGVARATRGAVGNKELAGLLGASPPRKAEEKANADIGVRLRSQARTPTPASTPPPTHVPQLAPNPTPVPTTEDTDALTTNMADTSQMGTPSLVKRKRPPGGHLLSALELKELGSTPVLETRTRARTATVEPTPEPTAIRSTVKPAPKHTTRNSSTAEVAAQESDAVAEASTAESAPEPAPKDVPAKRVRKSIVRLAATPAISSPFNLAAKSKGTPATSRKRAPAKQKIAETDKDSKTPSTKLAEALIKRKRGIDGEEIEKGATRASKRIAGTGAEGE
jgi:hypothetical protein